MSSIFVPEPILCAMSGVPEDDFISVTMPICVRLPSCHETISPGKKSFTFMLIGSER